MKECVLRSIGRFTIRKEPITPDIIKNIVAIHDNDSADDFKHLRITCICLISYASLIRYSEMSNLRMNDFRR